MTSATEVLRRLLDECGVEWDYGIAGPTTTRFSINRIDLTFTPLRGGLVCSTILTPAQAIAATLGSSKCTNDCTNSERTETCHIDLVGYNQREDRFQCRSCDWSMWFKRGTWPRFNYCPNCGRRVEQ